MYNMSAVLSFRKYGRQTVVDDVLGFSHARLETCVIDDALRVHYVTSGAANNENRGEREHNSDLAPRSGPITASNPKLETLRR
jgi:hypothetical protein